MKRILLTILTFISIFVITSCGKKKVLTKRTMDDFYDDFSFSQDEKGQKYYKVFKEYSSDEKSISNEFSSLTQYHYNRIELKTTKKIKIESVSYTVYNKSTDQVVRIIIPGNNEYYKVAKNDYYISKGSIENAAKKDILAGEEYEFTSKFDDLEIKKNSTLTVAIGLYSYDSNELKTNLANGGLYNFKIEYSAYI